PARQTLSNRLARTTFTLTRDAAKFSLIAFEPPKTIAAAPKKALSPEIQKRFDAGKAMYEMTCLACHQQHGLGQEGLAPPLVGSEWLASSPERRVRIVLNGLNAPIHVIKQLFELDLPSLNVVRHDQSSNPCTYV